MNDRIIAVIGGIIVGLFVGVFVVPTLLHNFDNGWRGFWRKEMMGGDSRILNRGGMMMSNIDRHFIEQMIPHHEGAIAMAKIAQEKGIHDEIKSFASGIAEAQTREIEDMRKWYKEWFGTDVPEFRSGMMGHGMMHMDTFDGDLEMLRASQDFDREFIRQMIPHHEMAVMMGRMLLSATERPQMKELADQIITSQSREIEMMRSWLAAW